MSRQQVAPPEWDLILSAAQKNDASRIQTLVTQRGVDPSHANGVGQSALHVAALWGHVEAVKQLLELNASVNTQNSLTGATPLHMVAQSHKPTKDSRKAVIELLLQNGADTSIADSYGSLPVNYVDLESYTKDSKNDDEIDAAYIDEIRSMLEPHAPEIFQAIRDCNFEEFQKILNDDNSSTTNLEQRFKSHTPLTAVVDQVVSQEATSSDSTTMIDQIDALVNMADLLIKKGCDRNAVSSSDDYSQSLIVSVVDVIRRKKDNIDPTYKSQLVRLAVLLKDVNAPLSEELTRMLYDAARRSNIDMLQFFLTDLKIDPNTANRQGMTALHFAARSGQSSAVDYLLSLATVDTTVKDNRGATAAEAARINNHMDIADTIEQRRS